MTVDFVDVQKHSEPPRNDRVSPCCPKERGQKHRLPLEGHEQLRNGAETQASSESCTPERSGKDASEAEHPFGREPRHVSIIARRFSALFSTFKKIPEKVFQVRIMYRESPLSDGSAGEVQAGDRLPWVEGTDNFAPLASLDWQSQVYGTAAAALCEFATEAKVPLHEWPWTPAVRRAGLERDALYLVRRRPCRLRPSGTGHRRAAGVPGPIRNRLPTNWEWRRAAGGGDGASPVERIPSPGICGDWKWIWWGVASEGLEPSHAPDPFTGRSCPRDFGSLASGASVVTPVATSPQATRCDRGLWWHSDAHAGPHRSWLPSGPAWPPGRWQREPRWHSHGYSRSGPPGASSGPVRLVRQGDRWHETPWRYNYTKSSSGPSEPPREPS